MHGHWSYPFVSTHRHGGLQTCVCLKDQPRSRLAEMLSQQSDIDCVVSSIDQRPHRSPCRTGEGFLGWPPWPWQSLHAVLQTRLLPIPQLSRGWTLSFPWVSRLRCNRDTVRVPRAYQYSVVRCRLDDRRECLSIVYSSRPDEQARLLEMQPLPRALEAALAQVAGSCDAFAVLMACFLACGWSQT